MAASLIVVLGLSYFAWRQYEPALMQSDGGALLARGPLATALSKQLSTEQSPGSRIHIGLSFLAKSGDYCRTFALSGAVSSAGFACHHGEEWIIQTLIETPGRPAGGAAGGSAYRTAASPMEPAVLASVEEQMAGEPLDQTGEAAARERGWRPKK